MCGSHRPASRAAARKAEQLAVVGAPVGVAQRLGLDPLLGGPDDVVDERPHPAAQLLEIGGQAEVDRHRRDSSDDAGLGGAQESRVWAVPRVDG